MNQIIIEYPNKIELESYNGQSLCRYLDIYKLLDFINNKRLVLTRLDKFNDPLEGLTEDTIILRKWISNPPLTEETFNKTFSKEDRERHIEQDKLSREQYHTKLIEEQKSQFASCWFRGEKESIAMWRLYSKKEGVMIKFNANQLIEEVVKESKYLNNLNGMKMTFGNIDYKNIWPLDISEKFNNTFSAMKKDKSYTYENEFRFIIAVPKCMLNKFELIFIPLNELDNLEFEIIASPFMESWEYENLCNLLSRYNINKRLKQSPIEVKTT